VKTLLITAVIAIVLIGGGYLFMRLHILRARDFKPDNSKAKNILDLRPAIIAKLQQLVKDGSNGLYTLSLQEIDPDILSSRLDAINGTIVPDTSAMRMLDVSKKLPDDIFNIKFSALHIDGIGIESLLHKNEINIKAIDLTGPIVIIDHKRRSYNEIERKKNDHLTIYQRLMNQMHKIAIGKITIEHARVSLQNHKEKRTETNFNDITISMDDLLIDSTTQYDQNRFLFARHARLVTKNFRIGTPDSLYFIKLGSIAIQAERHEIRITDAELTPRGNVKQFERKLKGREEMYHVIAPKIVFKTVDWWLLLNKESIVSRQVIIDGGIVKVFFDKSLPIASNEPMNHFPHQLIMMIPCPVLVNKLSVDGLKVVYTQYNPKTRSTGTSFFTDIVGTATHITNVPNEIKRYPFTDFVGKGMFMSKVPIAVKFKFDLLKTGIGEFTADVHMDSLTKELVNPISEPLGQFTIKSGEMEKGDAHVEGNNSKIDGKILIYYKDLHITPLKEDSSNSGLKRNHLKSFFANSFLIKNSNPEATLRSPSFEVPRDSHQNFISFIWTSIMTGLLKTIGIPVRLVMKDN